MRKTAFSHTFTFNTVLFNYTQMKISYLSRPPPNMNSIGEVCDSLGKDSLTSIVGNHWTTRWLRWMRLTRTRVKGGIICNSLIAYTGLKYYLQQSVVLLSAHVKRFSVSRMRDFAHRHTWNCSILRYVMKIFSVFLYYNIYWQYTLY